VFDAVARHYLYTLSPNQKYFHKVSALRINSMKDFQLSIRPFCARTQTKGLGKKLFLLHTSGPHFRFNSSAKPPDRPRGVRLARANIQNRLTNIEGNPLPGEHPKDGGFGGIPETDQVKVTLRGVIQVSPDVRMKWSRGLAGGLREEGSAEQLIIHRTELDQIIDR
jgi:hypothetical protein